MQQQIHSGHFAELLAEETIEPRGGLRGDLQAATVARVIANVNAAKGKTYKLRDFLPNYGPAPERQTQGEMKEKLKQLTLAMGGEIRGNNRHTGS